MVVQDGWIADLGTRRGFRKMGLGRAMLLTGLHQLRAKGMETALLGVDSENPSSAMGLYESVGFRKRHTIVSHLKIIG
jgi:ribosomal protein S18 acetylase RimI-like enzyme